MRKRRLDQVESVAARRFEQELGRGRRYTSGKIYGDAAHLWLRENEPKPEPPLVLPADSATWDLRDVSRDDWLRNKQLVYFLQGVGGGPVKIGRSSGRAFEQRLAGIQGGSPERLRLCRAVLGPQRLETALHKHFARLRIRGEWFRCDAELADVARAIAETDVV